MKTLALLMLVLVLSGCGIFKKKVETTETYTSDIKASTVTLSVKEKVDTVVKTKADSVVTTRPLDDLLKGKPIESTNGVTTVSVIYDSKTGYITAKGKTEAREIPIVVDKEATLQFSDVDSKSSSAKEVFQESETNTKGTGALFLVIIVLIAIIILLFWLDRKFR